jgi:hypothetical protein
VENDEKKSAATKAQDPPKDAIAGGAAPGEVPPPPPPPPAKPTTDPNGWHETASTEGWATRAFVGGLRALLPLVDEYARTKGPNDTFERGTDGSLSADERKAYGEAAVRLVYEGAAALRASSPQNQPEVVGRDPKTGRYPALTVADGVLAVRAIQSLLRTDSKPNQAAASIDLAPEVVSAPLVEVVNAGPRSPREIRSVAMQQRKAGSAFAGSPAPAYATQSQGYAVGAQPRVLRGGSAAPRAQKASGAVVYRASAKGGCGCGGSGARAAMRTGGCPSCGQQAQEPLATRNVEGKCEPNPFQMSCDTQVKLMQCAKTVLCDALWCLEAAICKNGQPSFKGVTGQTFLDCLGTALCSLVRCVPEVLCPPQTECGPLLPSANVECSYAVEELP